MNKIMNRILRAFAILLLLVVGLEKSNSYAVRNLAITNLVISPGTLSPIFSTANATYTCSEVYAVSSVTVTAVSNNPIGVIVNNGPSVTVSSGSPSKALSMNIGTNIITIQAGAGIVYSITVTRASLSLIHI